MVENAYGDNTKPSTGGDCYLLPLKQIAANSFEFVLLDSGKTGAIKNILECLKTYQGSIIVGIIITHYDSDHWSGLKSLCKPSKSEDKDVEKLREMLQTVQWVVTSAYVAKGGNSAKKAHEVFKDSSQTIFRKKGKMVKAKYSTTDVMQFVYLQTEGRVVIRKTRHHDAKEQVNFDKYEGAPRPEAKDSTGSFDTMNLYFTNGFQDPKNLSGTEEMSVYKTTPSTEVGDSSLDTSEPNRSSIITTYLASDSSSPTPQHFLFCADAPSWWVRCEEMFLPPNATTLTTLIEKYKELAELCKQTDNSTFSRAMFHSIYDPHISRCDAPLNTDAKFKDFGRATACPVWKNSKLTSKFTACMCDFVKTTLCINTMLTTSSTSPKPIIDPNGFTTNLSLKWDYHQMPHHGALPNVPLLYPAAYRPIGYPAEATDNEILNYFNCANNHFVTSAGSFNHCHVKIYKALHEKYVGSKKEPPKYRIFPACATSRLPEYEALTKILVSGLPFVTPLLITSIQVPATTITTTTTTSTSNQLVQLLPLATVPQTAPMWFQDHCVIPPTKELVTATTTKRTQHTAPTMTNDDDDDVNQPTKKQKPNQPSPPPNPTAIPPPAPSAVYDLMQPLRRSPPLVPYATLVANQEAYGNCITWATSLPPRSQHFTTTATTITMSPKLHITIPIQTPFTTKVIDIDGFSAPSSTREYSAQYHLVFSNYKLIQNGVEQDTTYADGSVDTLVVNITHYPDGKINGYASSYYQMNVVSSYITPSSLELFEWTLFPIIHQLPTITTQPRLVLKYTDICYDLQPSETLPTTLDPPLLIDIAHYTSYPLFNNIPIEDEYTILHITSGGWYLAFKQHHILARSDKGEITFTRATTTQSILNDQDSSFVYGEDFDLITPTTTLTAKIEAYDKTGNNPMTLKDISNWLPTHEYITAITRYLSNDLLPPSQYPNATTATWFDTLSQLIFVNEVQIEFDYNGTSYLPQNALEFSKLSPTMVSFDVGLNLNQIAQFLPSCLTTLPMTLDQQLQFRVRGHVYLSEGASSQFDEGEDNEEIARWKLGSLNFILSGMPFGVNPVEYPVSATVPNLSYTPFKFIVTIPTFEDGRFALDFSQPRTPQQLLQLQQHKEIEQQVRLVNGELGRNDPVDDGDDDDDDILTGMSLQQLFAAHTSQPTSFLNHKSKASDEESERQHRTQQFTAIQDFCQSFSFLIPSQSTSPSSPTSPSTPTLPPPPTSLQGILHTIPLQYFEVRYHHEAPYYRGMLCLLSKSYNQPLIDALPQIILKSIDLKFEHQAAFCIEIQGSATLELLLRTTTKQMSASVAYSHSLLDDPQDIVTISLQVNDITLLDLIKVFTNDLSLPSGNSIFDKAMGAIGLPSVTLMLETSDEVRLFFVDVTQQFHYETASLMLEFRYQPAFGTSTGGITINIVGELTINDLVFHLRVAYSSMNLPPGENPSWSIDFIFKRVSTSASTLLLTYKPSGCQRAAASGNLRKYLIMSADDEPETSTSISRFLELQHAGYTLTLPIVATLSSGFKWLLNLLNKIKVLYARIRYSSDRPQLTSLDTTVQFGDAVTLQFAAFGQRENGNLSHWGLVLQLNKDANISSDTGGSGGLIQRIINLFLPDQLDLGLLHCPTSALSETTIARLPTTLQSFTKNPAIAIHTGTSIALRLSTPGFIRQLLGNRFNLEVAAILSLSKSSTSITLSGDLFAVDPQDTKLCENVAMESAFIRGSLTLGTSTGFDVELGLMGVVITIPPLNIHTPKFSGVITFGLSPVAGVKVGAGFQIVNWHQPLTIKFLHLFEGSIYVALGLPLISLQELSFTTHFSIIPRADQIELEKNSSIASTLSSHDWVKSTEVALAMYYHAQKNQTYFHFLLKDFSLRGLLYDIINFRVGDSPLFNSSLDFFELCYKTFQGEVPSHFTTDRSQSQTDLTTQSRRATFQGFSGALKFNYNNNQFNFLSQCEFNTANKSFYLRAMCTELNLFGGKLLISRYSKSIGGYSGNMDLTQLDNKIHQDVFTLFENGGLVTPDQLKRYNSGPALSVSFGLNPGQEPKDTTVNFDLKLSITLSLLSGKFIGKGLIDYTSPTDFNANVDLKIFDSFYGMSASMRQGTFSFSFSHKFQWTLPLPSITLGGKAVCNAISPSVSLTIGFRFQCSTSGFSIDISPTIVKVFGMAIDIPGFSIRVDFQDLKKVIVGFIVKVIADQLSNLLKIVDRAVDFISDLSVRGATILWEGFNSWYSKTSDGLKNLGVGLAKLSSNLANTFYNSLGTAAKAVKDAVSKAFNTVTDFAGKVWKKIKFWNAQFFLLFPQYLPLSHVLVYAIFNCQKFTYETAINTFHEYIKNPTHFPGLFATIAAFSSTQVIDDFFTTHPAVPLNAKFTQFRQDLETLCTLVDESGADYTYALGKLTEYYRLQGVAHELIDTGLELTAADIPAPYTVVIQWALLVLMFNYTQLLAHLETGPLAHIILLLNNESLKSPTDPALDMIRPDDLNLCIELNTYITDENAALDSGTNGENIYLQHMKHALHNVWLSLAIRHKLTTLDLATNTTLPSAQPTLFKSPLTDTVSNYHIMTNNRAYHFPTQMLTLTGTEPQLLPYQHEYQNIQSIFPFEQPTIRYHNVPVDDPQNPEEQIKPFPYWVDLGESCADAKLYLHDTTDPDPLLFVMLNGVPHPIPTSMRPMFNTAVAIKTKLPDYFPSSFNSTHSCQFEDSLRGLAKATDPYFYTPNTEQLALNTEDLGAQERQIMQQLQSVDDGEVFGAASNTCVVADPFNLRLDDDNDLPITQGVGYLTEHGSIITPFNRVIFYVTDLDEYIMPIGYNYDPVRFKSPNDAIEFMNNHLAIPNNILQQVSDPLYRHQLTPSSYILPNDAHISFFNHSAIEDSVIRFITSSQLTAVMPSLQFALDLMFPPNQYDNSAPTTSQIAELMMTIPYLSGAQICQVNLPNVFEFVEPTTADFDQDGNEDTGTVTEQYTAWFLTFPRIASPSSPNLTRSEYHWPTFLHIHSGNITNDGVKYVTLWDQFFHRHFDLDRDIDEGDYYLVPIDDGYPPPLLEQTSTLSTLLTPIIGVKSTLQNAVLSTSFSTTTWFDKHPDLRTIFTYYFSLLQPNLAYFSRRKEIASTSQTSTTFTHLLSPSEQRMASMFLDHPVLRSVTALVSSSARQLTSLSTTINPTLAVKRSEVELTPPLPQTVYDQAIAFHFGSKDYFGNFDRAKLTLMGLGNLPYVDLFLTWLLNPIHMDVMFNLFPLHHNATLIDTHYNYYQLTKNSTTAPFPELAYFPHYYPHLSVGLTTTQYDKTVTNPQDTMKTAKLVIHSITQQQLFTQLFIPHQTVTTPNFHPYKEYLQPDPISASFINPMLTLSTTMQFNGGNGANPTIHGSFSFRERADVNNTTISTAANTLWLGNRLVTRSFVSTVISLSPLTQPVLDSTDPYWVKRPITAFLQLELFLTKVTLYSNNAFYASPELSGKLILQQLPVTTDFTPQLTGHLYSQRWLQPFNIPSLAVITSTITPTFGLIDGPSSDQVYDITNVTMTGKAYVIPPFLQREAIALSKSINYYHSIPPHEQTSLDQLYDKLQLLESTNSTFDQQEFMLTVDLASGQTALQFLANPNVTGSLLAHHGLNMKQLVYTRSTHFPPNTVPGEELQLSSTPTQPVVETITSLVSSDRFTLEFTRNAPPPPPTNQSTCTKIELYRDPPQK